MCSQPKNTKTNDKSRAAKKPYLRRECGAACFRGGEGKWLGKTRGAQAALRIIKQTFKQGTDRSDTRSGALTRA